MPMWIPRVDFSSSQPFYSLIVQSLADDIAVGRLATGDRLPTHRQLADVLGVARGTVAQAYALAEKHGLTRNEVGRGTFVLASESAGRPYGTLLEPPIVSSDLTTNYPLLGIDPDPADAFRALAERPDRMALLGYHSNLGARRHRIAGVEWIRRFGVQSTVDEVLLCAGAQHGLFVVLAHLLGPGEPLLVEEWSYPGLHAVAETLRIRLVAVAMDEEGLDPSALEQASRRHRASVAYIMSTGHNPLGSVQSESRRLALVAVARRNNIRIIEDAANQLLVPDCPPPLAVYAPERTYFLASVSKVLAPGLRVAFLVAPSEEIEPIAKHVWATHWMVSPLGPEVVTIWLESGIADETIARKRREAPKRRAIARRVLKGHDIRGHTGLLHLWLTLPRHLSADTLVAEARHQGIAVTPASAFWMRARPPPGAVRIALAGVKSRKDLGRGLRTLGRILTDSAKSDSSR